MPSRPSMRGQRREATLGSPIENLKAQGLLYSNWVMTDDLRVAALQL